MTKEVVKFVENSSNRKLANDRFKVSATYAPIKQSCSTNCKLKNKVCYAQTSYVGIINSRLEKSSENLSPEQIARFEREAIKESFKGKDIPQDGFKGKGRDLRIHVSGDTRTKRAASILAKASEEFVKRKGGCVWTYTHSHNIPRESWGKNISVLASIDDISQEKEVLKKGYAPAIVVEEFPGDKAFKIKNSKFKYIPCPAQTRDKTCVECRLCLDADRLFSQKRGIAFAVHGSRKTNLKKLKVLK